MNIPSIDDGESILRNSAGVFKMTILYATGHHVKPKYIRRSMVYFVNMAVCGHFTVFYKFFLNLIKLWSLLQVVLNLQP